MKLMYFNYLFLALLLTGCASMLSPESNTERLAYMEISYGVILDKATMYRKEGRLSQEQIDSMNKAFDIYENARDTARIAISIGTQQEFDTSTQAMVAALTTVRAFLTEIEQ